MKLLYITPNSNDPLAFYRGTGPLCRMRQDYKDFDFTDGKDISWATVRAHDLVFIQRPYKPEHLDIMKICKKWNVPVVIDYDDWLLDLPESNLAVDAFNASKATVMEISKLADHVMVTTEKLKELMTHIDVTNVTVVPNAYDARLFPYRRHQMDRSKIFLWRGGNSHLEDLLSVREALDELIAKHQDWKFGFIAQHPWMLRPAHNLHFIGGMGIVEYMKFIHDSCPAIMSHPLKRSAFNEAKSMCSWIEATHARACFVGPNFQEFERPGLVTYEADNSESYFKAVDQLITNPGLLIPNMSLSEGEILSSLEIRAVNKIRYEVFNKARG
jgi:hypothetical protein